MESRHPSGVEVLDGYRLIRFLGRGGFAEVWLCRSDAMGDYRALKWLPAGMADRLQKEYDSLVLYRNAAASLRSPHLVPIEHINRNEAGLFYIMPLADGMTNGDPGNPDWQPKTLAALIEARGGLPQWFSAREIQACLTPILQALQTLSDASLVHRDVKPENILFFNGSPCLGDISLLGEDTAAITRRGTPGYSTPSWYVGGNPDMYGAAATLYTLLTGNLPDKMGRAAFIWPPQGEHSIPESERAKWKCLHAVIRRATEEKVAERYVDMRAMADAVADACSDAKTPAKPVKPKGKRKLLVWAAACAVLALMLMIMMGGRSPTEEPTADENSSAPAVDAKPAPALAPASPLSKPSGSASIYQDAQLAYNSLTWVQNLLPHLGLSSEQHNLFVSTLSAIHSHIWSQESLEPQLAVRKLDLCLNAIDGLRDIPNVMLARLLLLQAAGDSVSAQKEISNPLFTTPGRDNLSYRVQLLCRLNAADKAEILLNRVLEDSSLNVPKRSEALIKRAEVRARLAKFPEAHKDASSALEVTGEDAALKAGVEMKLMRLESDFPHYAAWLRASGEK